MSALRDNSTSGIPNTEERAAENIHQEGTQYVKEATHANQGEENTVPSALSASTDSKSHSTSKTDMEEDTPVQQKRSVDPEEEDGHKPPKAADKSAGHGKSENPDAIPTAGGQRLGEEHWGESKIVPDLPEKRASTSGQGNVSSQAGQPTSEVADNTAANTGGATGGPGSNGHSSSSHDNGSGEKQGTLEKIKDKLNIGKK
ncbi:hypothetical protein CERZMDRAFT_89658 [Cercospora zeae-maydis SCOH1-5]|uniref:Uncharacterized protein n=1 Tax=Cercospora zeae-maydis SCOH1-5 TaxID=717836 RepID=A0A6A6FWX4_9PEZI|nr:hypothetical protein CERZMDRAFT_89658 [Cercospora zeae-maydis SCOH1-5]